MGLCVAEYTVTRAKFSVGGILNAITRPIAELSASEGAIFQTARPIKAIPWGAARIRLRMLAAPLGTPLVGRAVRKMAPSEADNSATVRATAFKTPPTEKLAPITVYTATQSPMGDTFFRDQFRVLAISRQTEADTDSALKRKVAQNQISFRKGGLGFDFRATASALHPGDRNQKVIRKHPAIRKRATYRLWSTRGHVHGSLPDMHGYP